MHYRRQKQVLLLYEPELGILPPEHPTALPSGKPPPLNGLIYNRNRVVVYCQISGASEQYFHVVWI